MVILYFYLRSNEKKKEKKEEPTHIVGFFAFQSILCFSVERFNVDFRLVFGVKMNMDTRRILHSFSHSANRSATFKSSLCTHNITLTLLYLSTRKYGRKLFRNEHYAQIEWNSTPTTLKHWNENERAWHHFWPLWRVCSPIKWGEKIKTNHTKIHKIGNYIKCSLYERIFPFIRLCIFIFMSLLLAWEHYAAFIRVVRQSCWNINKHSYTQFNSHENKCFYDDYIRDMWARVSVLIRHMERTTEQRTCTIRSLSVSLCATASHLVGWDTLAWVLIIKPVLTAANILEPNPYPTSKLLYWETVRPLNVYGFYLCDCKCLSILSQCLANK